MHAGSSGAVPAIPIPSAKVTQKTDIAISSPCVFFIVQFLNSEMCNLSDGVCLQAAL